MKKIDIHCHVIAFPEFSTTRPNGQNFLSAEEQIAIHDKAGVELGVLLPLISPEARWSCMSNEETQYVVSKYPDRFTWFCNVDPRQGRYNAESDLLHLIGQYKEKGAKGLGELTATLYADDPMMQNLFSSCVQLDMPVLIHIAPQHGNTYGIVDELGLPRIEKMLKKFPDLKLIGHSAAFWGEISADLVQENRNGYPTGKITEGRLPKLMREYGNLYCDLSAGSGSNAMMRDPEYAAKFLTEFADRIYYGADVCAPTQTFQYDFIAFLENLVKEGGLSQENYEKIMRKNAVKLLGLSK
ncbi:MAG: amidohydrolase family protein [Oscillospiraceae bacterium]|nr:amidohydrolase family protein [Oscillospiraceae bacterium]